jgi:hypothetical protein
MRYLILILTARARIHAYWDPLERLKEVKEVKNPILYSQLAPNFLQLKKPRL